MSIAPSIYFKFQGLGERPKRDMTTQGSAVIG